MKLKTNVRKFRAEVHSCAHDLTPLDVRVGSIDSVSDFKDIIGVCDMILQDKSVESIERTFGNLDTLVRDAFPLNIFNRNGRLKID